MDDILWKSTSTTSDRFSKHCGNTSYVTIWRNALLAWPRFSIWDTLLMNGGCMWIQPRSNSFRLAISNHSKRAPQLSRSCQLLPQVHVGIFSYHLALESSHQGRSERKIILVWVSTENIQRVEISPLLDTSARILDLQQPFEVEIDASDYAIGAVLTQHGHPVAYHSETLLDTVQKYPTYDKDIYSIVQDCRKCNHYILGKEMVIHTDHRPLQFIQTQGKLQNDRHQKWSTYLQQIHLNIKYKKGNTNNVVDCLS